MSGKIPNVKTPMAAIITGRNLDMNMFTQIVSGEDLRLGDTVIKGQPYGV